MEHPPQTGQARISFSSQATGESGGLTLVSPRACRACSSSPPGWAECVEAGVPDLAESWRQDVLDQAGEELDRFQGGGAAELGAEGQEL